MYDAAAIAKQVARIRFEISRDGRSTVDCTDLRILCPEEFTVSQQFMHIAEIAWQGGWSFAFLPDGSVEFGSVEKPTGETTSRRPARTSLHEDELVAAT